jgi:hypothetical protein
MLDFKTWYRSMTAEEKQEFARRAGLSQQYIQVHLVYRRRIPRPDTMRKLAEASLGRLSYEDIVSFFLLSERPAA